MPRTAPTIRKKIYAQQREKRRIERHGVQSAHRLGLRMRAAAIQEWRHGRSPENILASIADEHFTPLLTDGMVAAHLSGRLRVIDAAQAAIARAGSNRPKMQYGSALDFLARRLNLDALHLQALKLTYGAAALEVTRRFSAAVEQKVAAAIRAGIKDGDIVKTGTHRIRQAFEAAGVTAEQATTAAGRRQPHLFETLFRTQVNLAYTAGRVNAANDPDISMIHWGWEYVTIGDNRVRPAHAELNGIRRAKGDPVWGRIMPPNGFNCRCDVIEVFKDEIATYPETTPRITAEPDEGFDFNPGALYSDMLRPAGKMGKKGA